MSPQAIYRTCSRPDAGAAAILASGSADDLITLSTALLANLA
jgi:hypothetical protein